MSISKQNVEYEWQEDCVWQDEYYDADNPLPQEPLPPLDFLAMTAEERKAEAEADYELRRSMGHIDELEDACRD